MDHLEDSIVIIDELTADNLKDLNFSRAKLWSKWMNNLTKMSNAEDTNDVVDIEEFDEIYGPSDEEQQDEIATDSIEHSDNIVTDDSGLDISVIEQTVTVTSAHNVLAVIAQNPNTTGIINEDREFLEKALPFFENYNRDLRKDGLEKVLCTFDEVEIDKKARQMLGTTMPDISPYNERRHFRNETHFPHRYFNGYEDDTDSDSVDTARYIKLSKKECKLRNRYATKTTTIKSYRMIQSKRDQLHKKYCYLMAGGTIKELYRNVNTYHCSAGSCCQSGAGLRSVGCSFNDYRFAYQTHSFEKHQRKLDYNSSLSSTTSFDEEDFLHSTERFNENKMFKSCPSYCFSSHCHAESHRAGNSAQAQQKRNNIYKQDHKSFRCCRDGLQPLRHKFKQNCKMIDKSCSNVRYLTNSSADDGILKNDCSSREDKAIQVKEKNDALHLDEETVTNSTNVDVKVKEEEEKPLSNENKMLAESNNVQKEDLKPKNNKNKAIKKKPKSIKSKETIGSIQDDSFELELQLAIQASKDLYAEELKKRQIENSNENVNCSDDKKDEPKTIAQKNVNLEEKSKNLKTTQLKKQRAYKKKRYATESVTISSDDESETNDNNLPHKSKNKIYNKKKPTKIETQRTNKTARSTENTTFFTNLSEAYNSTAKNIDAIRSKTSTPTALTHDDQPSTTEVSKHKKVELEKCQEPLEDKVTSSNVSNDCTLVSSTNESPPVKGSVAQEKPISKSLSTSFSRLVLYAPHNSTLIPNSSFVNDKFRLTLEHLSAVIGQKYANVFFRYYKGKRDFKLTSTVYYFPPKRGYYSGDDTSDSDVDIFDVPDIGRVVEECN